MISLLAHVVLVSQVSVKRLVDSVIVSNGQANLTLSLTRGSAGIEWGQDGRTQDLFAETRLSDGVLRNSSAYLRHEIGASDVREVHDKFGTGVLVVIHHRKDNEPELRQEFWMYEGQSEVLTRLTVVGANPVTTNYLAPMITTSPVSLAGKGEIQSLFVPYDNDMYFRYRSDGWGEGEGDGDGSYGLGAIYDDVMRRGIVVGVLDHDTWKSAVRFKRGDGTNASGLTAYAGVTSKYTHDTQPHGSITGKEVSSPRMSIGLYADWRAGLERFGDLNLVVNPLLKWKGAVPFGWNSWAGHKTKVNANDAKAATDFFDQNLSNVRTNGTAFINFDSFWDNLKRPELLEFVRRAHEKGLKAGIYYTPFTGWSDLDRKVNGTNYTYRDLVMKDAKGEPQPKLDGGWPLDPTHPGSIARIDKQLADFVAWGFDFVKFDFLSHGSMEGPHYDPKIMTGTQAYAFGMKRIADDLAPAKVGRPIFISLSIAPLFPNVYAHSRRISCDVFSNIGATEYLMNSSTYAWWENRRIYPFSDADATCVYQPMDEPPVTEAESISRMTATVISGGMLFSGDDLTKPEARARVEKLFTNREVIDLAKKGLAFRPIDGHTATTAGDQFVWIDSKGRNGYLAIFNYGKTDKDVQVGFVRAGFGTGTWNLFELWTGEKSRVQGELSVSLPPMTCRLYKVSKS